MSCSLRLIPNLAAGVALVMAISGTHPAEAKSPEAFNRCFAMYKLWNRYETAHCPNQTGQRAQAEWAIHNCEQDDFQRGLEELQRLLRRDLIEEPR